MKTRLLSVDVLRGLTIMLMTIVNNPGDWGNVYAPLLHAEWHGWTPTDLVFPFFLFVMGIAVPLAMPEKVNTPETYQKIAVRTLRIICLGLFLNFFSFLYLGNLEGWGLLFYRLFVTAFVVVAFLGDYPRRWQLLTALGVFVLMLLLAFGGFETFVNVRIPGVLQRIGLVYGIIAVIYLNTTQRTQVYLAVAILLAYWAIMTLVPVPDGTPPNVTVGTNLAAWIDNQLLGSHNWSSTKTWDPEGILSTLPAISTGILGLIIGQLLRGDNTSSQTFRRLVTYGIGGIVIGLLWNMVFPINKALWTSSFVVLTAGLATLLLSVFYFFAEINQITTWTKPFIIFGVNPMVVFFFSGIIPDVLEMTRIPMDGEEVGLQTFLYESFFVPFFSNPKSASLAGALTYLIIWFVILVLFYRKKLIFKV